MSQAMNPNLFCRCRHLSSHPSGERPMENTIGHAVSAVTLTPSD
jgi:hypothetical protein